MCDRNFVLIAEELMDIVYKTNPDLYEIIDDLVQLSKKYKVADDSDEVWNIK